MRIVIILTWLLATSVSAMAQVTGYGISRSANTSKSPKELKEYRFRKGSGKLILEMNNVKVEGYDGNEVVLTMPVEIKEIDERAVGLAGISGAGLRDNTGMGVSVSEDGDVTEIRLIKTFYEDSVLIKVPKQLAVSIIGTRTFGGKNISLKNIQGEIEITTTVNDILLENVTGPMSVKTAQGNIEVVLNAPVKGPVSLMSTLGFIDLALPVTTKANVDMGSTLGELFAADDFNIDIQEKSKQVSDSFPDLGIATNSLNGQVLSSIISRDVAMYADEVNIDTLKGEIRNLTYNRLKGNPRIFGVGSARANNAVFGTINGGGENIILRTTQGKIYLRTTEKK